MLTRHEQALLRVVEGMAMRGQFETGEGFLGFRAGNEAEAALSRAGFKHMGGGSFSQVVAAPSVTKHVIKVTPVEYDGYHAYVEFVEWARQNLAQRLHRFLPVIYASENVCGVRITMQETLGSAYTVAAFDAELRALQGHGEYAAEFPDAYEFSKELRKYRINFSRYNLGDDLHSGNIMRRLNGELVVIDPWTGTEPDGGRYSSTCLSDEHECDSDCSDCS